MNFSLNVAYNVDRRVSQIERHDGWTDVDESMAHRDILKEVVKQDKGTWASGDIRIGEIILIIDCDSRIPEDCLLDAANEFDELDDVAILQHKSCGMGVAHNPWEAGVLYFTRLIYAATAFAAAAGKMGPFLGSSLFDTIQLTLGITLLSVGHHCKKCHGFKMAK